MAKFRPIAEAIRKEIEDGRYAPKERLPTESQLVARFKVSRPTVARALRVLEDEGLLDRRVGSGTYLKKAPQTGAGKLGLIVPALGKTEIFDPICAELFRHTHDNRFTLLSSGSRRDEPDARAQQAEELCHRFIREQVSGVFFAPIELIPEDEAINHRITEALDAAGIPIVLLDRDTCKFPRRSKFDLVGIDNFAAGFELTQHLVQLGCRRINFVAHPHSAATVDLRIAGWREAMVRAGLEHDASRVCSGFTSDDAFVRATLQRGRPEAIICANDMTAAVFMQTLTRIGIKVPADVRLVGFDDLKYASLLPIPLTTMHQPCQEIGHAAFQAMQTRIANPAMARREILLNAALVVRESCGAQMSAKPSRAKPPTAAAR